MVLRVSAADRPLVRRRFAVAAALLAFAFSAAVLLYHRDKPEQRLLRHANAVVAKVESGEIEFVDELRRAMPPEADSEGRNEGRLELSWYLGPNGWFGVRLLIVHADPRTERIERAYVVFD